MLWVSHHPGVTSASWGWVFPISVPKLGPSRCSFHPDSQLLLPLKLSQSWGKEVPASLCSSHCPCGWGAAARGRARPGAPAEPWDGLEQLQWSTWEAKSTSKQEGPGDKKHLELLLGWFPPAPQNCCNSPKTEVENFFLPFPRDEFSALWLCVQGEDPLKPCPGRKNQEHRKLPGGDKPGR